MFASKIGATLRLLRGGCKLIAAQSDRAADLVWFYVLEVSQGVTKTAVVCRFPLKFLCPNSPVELMSEEYTRLVWTVSLRSEGVLVVLLVNETIR